MRICVIVMITLRVYLYVCVLHLARVHIRGYERSAVSRQPRTLAN